MTAPPIKAIETSYAGCRFRSRLEARWAVFFDHLGIDWQYEPQGYRIGPVGEPYLPDFWLPKMRRWVEVKGELTAADLRTLIFAASGAGLPLAPDVPLRRDSLYPWHKRILLLGDIPEPGRPGSHARIDAVGEELIAWTAFFFLPAKPSAGVGALDVEIFGYDELNQFIVGEDPSPERLVSALNPGLSHRHGVSVMPRVDDAYRAARSARFEHGERG